MAARRRTSIPAGLRSLFPTRWLNAAARESGLVARRRKVAPAHLFWTLVLGFAVGHRRSLASLRRFFQASTGVALVASSFVGSHLARVAPLLNEKDRAFVMSLHERAKAGDLEALRGAWRVQEDYFARLAVA